MSTPPIPYTRQASFTQFATEQFPTTGQGLEGEFNKISQSIGTTQSRLAEIQRDDGKLRNGIVTLDALDQQSVDVFGGATGYAYPVPYAGGLKVEHARFTVTYNGYRYAPRADLLPFVTPDVFDDAQWQLVTGVALGDLAADDGASLVREKLVTESRTVADILAKDIMISVSNSIPLSHTGDMRALIQAALDDAASAGRVGRREVVFRARGEYMISDFLSVPSGTRLIFDGDARMMPSTSSSGLSTGNGLRSYGSLPTTTYAPTADIAFGDYKIPAGASAALFAAGDYVWLESSDVIDTSPNTRGIKKAQMVKVMAVDGSNNLVLDRLIEYDFPASTSTFGKANIVTGVRVENFCWGDPSMTVRSSRGIDFRFHDDLRIIDSDIGWSRVTAAVGPGTDTENMNAINLVNCSNVVVDRLKVNRVAWYGVCIDGASHNVTVRGVDAHLCRHGVSLNWNGPGEPIHILVSDSSSSVSSLAGFDMHDVGRDITFRKLRATGTPNDGFQVRTSGVLLEDIVAESCSAAGARIYGESTSSHDKLQNITMRGVRINKCGVGISSVAAFTLSDFTVSNCVNAGVTTMGGFISDGTIKDSSVAIFYHPANTSPSAKRPLTVRDVDAPASPNQTMFMRSTQAYTDQGLRIRDVRAIGYDSANLFTRTAGQTYIADIDHKGCSFGTDHREGTVTLVAGTATVTNNNIKVPASVLATRVFRSAVDIQRLSAGGTVGSYTVTLSDGQFVITSSSNTDTSTVRWRII